MYKQWAAVTLTAVSCCHRLGGAVPPSDCEGSAPSKAWEAGVPLLECLACTALQTAQFISFFMEYLFDLKIFRPCPHQRAGQRLGEVLVPFVTSQLGICCFFFLLLSTHTVVLQPTSLTKLTCFLLLSFKGGGGGGAAFSDVKVDFVSRAPSM